MILIYTCLFMAIITMLAILGSLIYFHFRKKSPDQMKQSLKKDLMWALIPMVILILMAYPAIERLI